MEELVTLHYGNFSILGEWVREFAQRTGCSNWVANWTLQSQVFLNELRREHLGWSITQKQEWGLFLLECMLHNGVTIWKEECQRHSRGLQSEMAESVPEHPSVQTLLGSCDTEILKVAEQVYQGECVVASSVLSHRQQDNCMRELHQELTRHMTRAGLQSKTGPGRPSSRHQGCSHGHSASQTQSPSDGPQGGQS